MSEESKTGTQSGAIEHRYQGHDRLVQSQESRDAAQLLIQEAQIRRDFGEEGVRRFWEEVTLSAVSKENQ